MTQDTFTLFSPVHFGALFLCLLIPVLVAKWGKASPALTRRLLAIFCVVTWLASTLYPILVGRFRWEESLPLHFCNIANLLGAAAVLGKHRWPRTILYFWGIVLCLWAFLTPSLNHGPTKWWFWIFWLYHLSIPLTLVWILVREKYRPQISDLRTALFTTWSFTLGLAVLDYFTKWNYGFVGPGMPLQPSPMDALGPYPLRIFWMLTLGTVLFTLAWLPWRIVLGNRQIT